MKEDPIVQEVRRAREAHAQKHGFNLDAIFADLKAQQNRQSHKVVSLPPKPYLPP